MTNYNAKWGLRMMTKNIVQCSVGVGHSDSVDIDHGDLVNAGLLYLQRVGNGDTTILH